MVNMNSLNNKKLSITEQCFFFLDILDLFKTLDQGYLNSCPEDEKYYCELAKNDYTDIFIEMLKDK